jgi:pyruvyl transferase EpsO
MFFITTTTFAVIITGFKVISPLLVISLILMAASAYWSSLDPPQPGGGESRGKLYMLLFFCMTLLLFQCTIVVLNNAVTFVPPATVQTNTTKSGLPPIRLDPEFEFNRLICLRKVRERVLHEVGSRIRDGEPVSFMDLPMHSNLGDVFIWQGTQVILEVRSQFPLVSDGWNDRNISKILPQLRNGVVLLQGGGNFGDLWRDSANFRTRAVKQIKDNDLIFLPQSVNYTKPVNMKSDNTTFQLNNRTLFMFRDYPSLNYSLQHFTNKPAMYVPDMAFVLGPQTPVAHPIVDIVLLLRLDKEKVIKLDQRKTALNKLTESGVSFEVWDFPILGFPLKVEKDKTVIYNYTKVYPKQLNTLKHNTRHAYLGHRTQMANNLFSRGRLIITDRLHATIFTTLMGKPVIYLDNTYKKIANVRGALAKEFHECSDQNLHALHTSTLPQAVELALQILSGSMKI